jgi:CDGSH-type Zn-finger protein
MSGAVVAQKTPFPIAVEGGKTYYWCSCGLSKAQPFCDGSHKGGAFVPLAYKAEDSKTVYFCGCKATAMAPLCDGSHAKL